MAKKSYLADVAYKTIRDEIISFQLPPYHSLSDNALAAGLNMSRAPVREALLQLVADGLVEDTNGKFIVAPIGLREIIDILQVRRAIETEAVRVIAENGWLTDEQKNELALIFERLASSVTADSKIENYKDDDDFHTAIIGFSGNRRMAQMHGQMNLQMQRARWLNIAVPLRQHASQNEHKAIYEAILAKDKNRAVAAVEAHLRNSEQSFRQVFNDPALKQVMAGIHHFFS
jgi:DNA-binding GntR family transcriptional regulator